MEVYSDVRNDGCNLDRSFVYNKSFIGRAKLSNMLIGVDIPPIVVINLITRPDRNKTVIEAMKKEEIPFIFYMAIPHENPVRGCLESHINVVKWAASKKYKYVCIFEDDFIIQHPLKSVPPIPQDADMIYLGGLCTHVREWGQDIPQTDAHNFVGNKWIKGTFYCDHAYLVKDSVYQKIIEGWNYTRELDRFYTGEIHDDVAYNVYMPYVQYVIQYSGWSDIDKKDKWKDWRWPNPGETFNVP